MGKFKNPLNVEKKQREPTYNMTRTQLDSMAHKAFVEGIHTGIYICNTMYTASMLTVFHDKLGYDRDGLKKMHEAVQKLFNEVVEGYVSYKDLLETLEQEQNITLTVEHTDKTRVDALELFAGLEKDAKHKYTIHFNVDGRSA